jgi:hypothetical protein
MRSVRGCADDRAAIAPDIDRDEQEQPDHVHEVPVPGGEFEAEMLFRREVTGIDAEQADQRKMVPTSTWKPWKPVAMKKVAP